MKRASSRPVRWFALFVFLVSASGCGYILRPERRTQPLSTVHDTKIIVYDCLWLLAGVIPGVVALTVDGLNNTWFFTESELRQRQRRADGQLRAGERLAIRLNGLAPSDAEVSLRLLDAQGTELAPSVRERVQAGDADRMLGFDVPVGLYASEAVLVLAVDGRRQLTWTVTP